MERIVLVKHYSITLNLPKLTSSVMWDMVVITLNIIQH